MLHLHWCLWGCYLCAGGFLWAQSWRLQWEQSCLQAAEEGMHQDLVPYTRTCFLTPGLGTLHQDSAPYTAGGQKGSWCLIWLWSVWGHTHLVAVGGMSLTGLWLWTVVPGPLLFVALCGMMGSCTCALHKRCPAKSYAVVSPLIVSLLPSPFCFSCWQLWVLTHRRSWFWDVFSQVMLLNPLSFSIPILHKCMFKLAFILPTITNATCLPAGFPASPRPAAGYDKA